MRLVLLIISVLITVPGLASAQSVLERVLSQINGATNLAKINGTYANIAESVRSAGTVTPGITTTENVAANIFNAPDSTRIWYVDTTSAVITSGDIGKTFASGDGTTVGNGLPLGGAITVNADGSIEVDPGGGSISIYDQEGALNTVTGMARNLSVLPGVVVYQNISGQYLLYKPSAITPGDWTPLYVDVEVTSESTFAPSVSIAIDGSITNIITGLTAATAEAAAGAATATEFMMPALDFGDMATTALGAVNTGDITLGVNSAVDEAATTTTRAVSSVMTQIGGSADTGALVLNVASNAGAINGSIQNIMTQVNGTIGDLSTTALGAVNTGTITTGVNSAVQGIVGMSGQTASGL